MRCLHLKHMDITYDYYRTFYYVAACHSFTKAAELLLSNQPNVTRVINNLERQLGCRLFLRSNRGVTLTPEGEKLYRHVALAFQHLRQAEIELATDKSLQGGLVTVASSEIALHLFLLPVLRRFHMAYPAIRLCLTNHSTPQAVCAVRDGLADFAVISTPTDVQRPLRETELCAYRDILIAPADFPVPKKQLSLANIAELPLVGLGKGTLSGEFFRAVFLKYGLNFHPDTEASTADQLLPLIENGLGVGFVPEQLAKDALKEGRVIALPLEETIPQRSICLVEDKSRTPSLAAAALREMLHPRRGAVSKTAHA